MKKELITFEQLAALSFLKFVKLDENDMTVLMNLTKDIVDVKIKDDSSEYFITETGSVILESSFIEKFNKNVDIELFENMYTTNVYRYINDLNILEFVLRKIKLLGPGCVVKEEIADLFSSLQINAINKLYQEKYIVDYLHKDEDSDYQAVKLTKRGELQLFLIDNQETINMFTDLLRNQGYNTLLIEAFLITQDLSLDIKNILTTENYIMFCEEYDLNPYVQKDNIQSYSRVKIPSTQKQ